MKKALIISNITKKFQAGHFSMITPLEELGYEVHWAANFSDYKEDISKAPCKIHQIDFIRNPFNPKNYKAYKELMKLLNDENFDIVHCQSPIGGLLGRICGKKANVHKIIYTVHGFHFYKGGSPIKNLIYKFVENYLAKYTNALITINLEDYEYSKKMKFKDNGKSYHINGIGVDILNNDISKTDKEIKLQELNLSNEKFICITVGELNKNKNHENIIKAIAETKNKNIILLICGLGNKKTRLKKLTEELQVDKQIYFLGFRNDVKQLLEISDVFILASYREGLSRSIMEAMAVGLPCIVSKIRGNVDLIDEEKGGYLINPNKSNEMAIKITNLVNDEKLRNDMGEYNKEKVKQNDIENVKKEMRKIYEEVIKNEIKQEQ